MKNFLNIILIVLLTVLTVNLFSNNVKKEGLDISFSTSSYTVPATVVVKASNNTTEKVSLDACKDVTIRKNGDSIKFSDEFCKKYENVEVSANSFFDINYQSEYKNFKETGKYDLEVNLASGKKFTSSMNVENRWTFWKLFVTLIYAPIYNLFSWLISVFSGSIGWAIITITVIIRLLLIYPQQKSMVSQRKLQDLQPKIKKLQEEYKWNQQLLWQKLLELYKTEKVNPMWSCGFILIQLPIILVLYNVILWVQDTSNEYYLYSFVQLVEKTSNFFWLDLLGTGWTQGLILAVIIALLQFLQIKYSISQNKNTKTTWVVLEKKSGDDKYSQMMPDPEMMNKFMLYVLPLIVWFATYGLFAWVWVYWWISTLFILVQQIIVNKMFKKSS